MKKLSVLLWALSFVSLSSFAKNYYVAANGSDANNGTSSTTPWKSISKVNASFTAMVAGDSILFRRGDVFYGALVVGKSGSSGKPIVISAYGSGSKPVITGFVTASAWTSAGNGIYQASFPGAKSSLNMVVMNDMPQALGRYPNADAANGGYLNYETFSGSTSITDNQLTSATNWTGAEIAVRKKLWVIDRCKVTGHSGGTVTFSNATSTYTGTNGYGYFFQNDIRTLDKLGEWYFNNSTKKLNVYFGTASTSSYTVKAACIDTLLIISAKNYITINDIAFEGANDNAIYAYSGSNINILNCDFKYSGTGAIYTAAVATLLIENCSTNYSLSHGIIASSPKASSVTVRNNNVKNTGILAGMGGSSGNTYKGIIASALSNLLIEYNNVDTTGYVGIEFQGSNVNVRYNVVNYFDFVKDDGGGIYSYAAGTDAAPGTTYTNRVVSNNIVMNGAGAPYGRNSMTLYVTGIYMDGRTMNVSILNNTVFNNGKNGIHCNNPNGVTIRGNTSYNNLNAMSVMRWANIGTIKNLAIKNNIFFPKDVAQRVLYYTNSGLNEPATTTINADLAALGSVDSNTYNMVNPTGFNFEIYGTTGGALIQSSPYSLEAWRALTIHDDNGKKVAKAPLTYKLNSLIGVNKLTNGLFTTNISGITLYGSGATASWDNTAKIVGGSYKVSFSTNTANKYNLIHAPVGAVSSSKKYVLRFSTYGTTAQGNLRAYLRTTASPYSSITDKQVRTFVTGRKDHEILFDAPTTTSAANFCIEIEQPSGTTYIDNIEFYEVDATTYNVDDQVRFEYNRTKTAKTVSLDATYSGVDGTVYSGTVTLQPFTSLILVKDPGAVVVPPVTSALKAVATATAVNCFGSNSTVTVSASDGTGPYTGTGSFTGNAGKGAVKLSFNTAQAGQYTMLYYTIGGISASKNYALRFTTLGTTANGKLKASLRQTGTPYTVLTSKQEGTFGTTRKDHQFIFKAPTAEAAASFLIEIEQASGTTYIDNIALFECDAEGTLTGNNLYSDGQLETDISKVFHYSGNGNHTITWDNTGKIPSTYYFTVKDATGKTSVAPVTIVQPSAPLTVSITAGLITVLNGRASVSVTATGGTAPYTGIGSFSVLAGTYTYTITDAKGCTASKSVTILPFVSARPANTTTTTNARVRSNTIENSNITSDKLQLNAYPNPSAGAFNLSLEGGSTEKVVLQVYSIDNKLVYQTTGNSNSRYSFGNNFNPGMYILKVMQGSDVQTIKLVKGTN